MTNSLPGFLGQMPATTVSLPTPVCQMYLRPEHQLPLGQPGKDFLIPLVTSSPDNLITVIESKYYLNSTHLFYKIH